MRRNFRSRKPYSTCSPCHRSTIKSLVAKAQERELERHKNLEKTLGNSQAENFEVVPFIPDPQNNVPNDLLFDNPIDFFNNIFEPPEVENIAENDGSVADDHDAQSSVDHDSEPPLYSSDSNNDASEHDDSDNDSEPSNYNESETDEQQDNVKSMEDRLATVFKTTNMTHVQSKAILKALKEHECFQTIHVDPRSILGTPKSTNVERIGETGQYLHLGFREGLLRILQNTPPNMIPEVLNVDFSTDEASLDKASNIIMWPVQIRITNISMSNPQVVGVYQGESKPDDPSIVLQPFIDEVLQYFGEEITFPELGYAKPFQLRCFIADAPARSFCLCSKNHKATAPCHRCWINGISLGRGIMIYRGIGYRRRTDEEYRAQTDGEHHNDENDCPLFQLNIDIVWQTIFDSMHLAYIGVMNKILQGLVDNKFSDSVSLTEHEINMMGSRLRQLRRFCPSDFARRPKNLRKHGSFKATELRQILLYTGPALFFGIVNPSPYIHFLLFHAAMRFMTNPNLQDTDIDTAQSCVNIFILRAEEVYGATFLSYNVHGLEHLPEDARLYGNLEDISAFPYENNMTFFRKMCRKQHQHLQQIARRYAEKKDIFAVNRINKNFRFWGVCGVTPVPPDLNSENFTRYSTFWTYNKKLYLTIYQNNNTILLHDSTICVIQTILKLTNGEVRFVVKKFDKQVDFYDSVCKSSRVGVFHCGSLSSQLKLIKINEIQSKCFRMPYWPELVTDQCTPNEYIVAIISSSTTWFANLS